MRFLSVEGGGFKSIDYPLIFQLDRKPGLYHITGRNEDNERLGANGVGKSTIFELVFWIIYGHTTRNLKAVNIHTWNSKQDTYGILRFLDSEGINHAIKRTWKPNKLMLSIEDNSWIEVDDQEILHLIGLNTTAFLNSVYISQFSTMFFDMKHQEQATLFSTILDLDQWLERSKLAGRKASEHGKNKDLAERIYAEALGKWTTLLGSIEDLKQEYKDSNAIALDTATNLKKELDKNLAEFDEVEKSKKELQDQYILLGDWITHSSDLLNHVQLERKPIADDYNSIVDDLEFIEGKADRLDAEALQISSSDKCSTCGHKLSSSELKDLLKTIKSKVRKLDVQATSLESELKVLGNDLDHKDSLLEEIQEEITSLRDERSNIRDKINKKGTILSCMESDNQARMEAIKQLNSGGSNILKLIDNYEQSLEIIKDSIITQQDAIVFYSREYSKAHYWIKGFKEVRLYVIEQALTDLEIEVNSVLDSLGLEGWQVKFEVERETTAKTIKKGFIVMIYSPDNDKPVPWQAWSGGEATRLRIAGTSGLCNLVSAATGVSSNIEIWDEPTQYMSGEGIQEMLEMLAFRAVETGKAIYLIDHHSVQFGGFNDSITIVKDKTGSYIE